jgi:tRNA threonylcarbamoyladenosine biosynthesis protein TsaE
MLAPLHVHLSDEAATRRLGERLARLVLPGMTVHLCGDLGSGKTTFARGVLRGLGFTGKVKSPTYTLVEPYIDSRLTLYHFDLFRFRDPGEWREAGFGECFGERSICLIEWPEKAAGLLPPADVRLRLTAPRAGGRDATLDAETAAGRSCLTALARSYAGR